MGPHKAGWCDPTEGKGRWRSCLWAVRGGFGVTCRALGAFWVLLQCPIPICCAEWAVSTARDPKLLLFDQETPAAQPHTALTALWLPQHPHTHALTLWALLGTPKMSTHLRPSSTRGRSIPSSLFTPYLSRAKGSSCQAPRPAPWGELAQDRDAALGAIQQHQAVAGGTGEALPEHWKEQSEPLSGLQERSARHGHCSGRMGTACPWIPYLGVPVADPAPFPIRAPLPKALLTWQQMQTGAASAVGSRGLEASPVAHAQGINQPSSDTGHSSAWGAGFIPGLSRKAGNFLHGIRAVTVGGGWDRHEDSV